MIPYIGRRLLASAFVMFGLVTLTFLAAHFIGDPVNLLTDKEFTSPEEREYLRQAGGFDRPVFTQYLDYVANTARGDFGTSIWQNRPAATVVGERLKATAYLSVAALILTFAIAVPLAVFMATRERGRVHLAITVATTAMGSLPSFFLALSLIYLFAVRFRVLPTSGYGSWQTIILPALALAVAPIGRFTQVIEASVSAELRQKYVSTARAKGLRESVVLRRHVLRNTAILGVTLLGGELVLLLNGAVLVESIFAWPGVGQVSLTAIQRRDLPVVMAAVIVLGLTVTIVNLLVDIAYSAADPRVRLR